MRAFKRLLCACGTFATIFLVLELSRHFGDVFYIRSASEVAPSDFESVPNLQEAKNLPDILYPDEFLRWEPVKKCAKFPQLGDIITRNQYWQVLAAPNSTSEDYFLFGAYYDSRVNDVKVLALLTGTQPEKVFCNVWYEKGVEPITVAARSHYIWNPKWLRKESLLNSHLFSCALPNQSHPVEAVSLTRDPCAHTTNLLKVNHHQQPQPEQRDAPNDHEFVVCVKSLDFPMDISYKLIEWIELIRLLGADLVHFYIARVHPNVGRVLEHYRQFGWIQTDGWAPPGEGRISRAQAKRFELVPINDCFYKHREEYRHVVLLDVDEVIMLNVGNWLDLVGKLREEGENQHGVSTFAMSNAYFFDESLLQDDGIPQHMHMLRHVYRSRAAIQPEWFAKGFHSTEQILSLHNHHAIACLDRECEYAQVPFKDAKIAHYRTCPKVLPNEVCDHLTRDVVRDDAIRRYETILLRNVARAIEVLELKD